MAGVITPAQYVGGGGGGAVSSVFGRSGVVIAAIGDYTVAQVTGAASQTFVTTSVATETARAEAAEALLAPLASPALTGTPTAPTAAPGDTSTQLATDAFVAAAVTAAVQGLAIKPSVQAATTTALPANTYSNGASGVGATLTAVLAGVLVVDGITVALGNRVLVQDEVAAANNGIYVVTTPGTVSVAYILTRAADMNQAAEVPGAFTFVEQGTVNAGAGFTVAGAGPYVIGTTAINWTQFSGAGEVTAGTGLTKTGNTLSVTTPASPYAAQTLGAPAASITFSAIPAGFSLLRLLVIGASAAALEADRWLINVNGNSAAIYDLQAVNGIQSTASASRSNATSGWLYPVGGGAGDLPGASATAGVAGILEIQIPIYAGTTFQKTGLWRSGYSDAATAAADQLISSSVIAWRSTAAITSITIATSSASNLVTGTTALLYLT
jgi:hypothetical protein